MKIEKEKLYKILIIVYFLFAIIFGFRALTGFVRIKTLPPSKFETLNTRVLDTSSKALETRNYVFNSSINSVDLNNFVFGNSNPFR